MAPVPTALPAQIWAGVGRGKRYQDGLPGERPENPPRADPKASLSYQTFWEGSDKLLSAFEKDNGTKGGLVLGSPPRPFKTVFVG